MKSNKNTVVLIVLILIFAFPVILAANFNNFASTTDESLIADIDSNLKGAGYWYLTDSPIFIDDSDPNYNWSKTASENNWCNGEGTLSNPYIIENITIVLTNSSWSGILIKNSQIHFFTIRNVIVHIEGYGFGTAGIKLENTNRGTVTNNTCVQISSGIFLLHSDNNTISGNILKKNTYGINLRYSIKNNISGNTINDSDYGIFLRDSSYNIISGNIVNDFLYIAYHQGIYLSSNSNNNTISGNSLNEFFYGIWISGSQNNTLASNDMNDCGLIIIGSIEVFRSHHIDSSNLVNGKPLYLYIDEIGLDSSNFTNAGQVILVNCNDSLLLNLNISNGAGISLYYCNNNNLEGNIVNGNSDGIYLRYSNNNTISGNDLVDNIDGIYLSSSHNNTITGNHLIDNSKGITLNYCNYNNLSGNIVNYGDNGIHLIDSHHNTISNNTANNHWDHGIFISWSQYNTISGNIAKLNDDYGIWLYGNDVSTILDNTVNYNRIGIVIGNSESILILNNTANNNTESGIHLYTDSNSNTISNNTANYNGEFGIYLSNSDHNIISGNRLFGNDACICEDSCQGNTFSDNGDCTIIRRGDNGNLIPGYDLFCLLCILSITVILISKRLKKS